MSVISMNYVRIRKLYESKICFLLYNYHLLKKKKKQSVVQWLACSSRVFVDRVFESRSGQTKDYKIGICCFSAMHTVLRRNSLFARNQDNVPEWGDISIRRLLFR